MKTTTILFAVIAFILVLLFAMSFFGGGTLTFNENSIKDPINDPIDVSSDFANAWLENLQATTTLPLGEFLDTQTVLTKELKSALLSRADTAGDRDVILCQATMPERIGGKQIYVTDEEAQVSVIPRGGEKSSNQTLVTLGLQKEAWVITGLDCSTGEVAPETGLYNFERAGQLIGPSVPEPYDANFWHIVFERDGINGNVVKLLFDSQSVCIEGSSESTCDTNNLTEAAQAFVQADMTEEGALIKRLEIR